ncbi:hypothetical protein [Dietzia natronolimnaea]|nr:hypothetical protein [Dietzia natronolimnaea]
MFAVIGAALLIGSFLPHLLRERVLSAPIVVVGRGHAHRVNGGRKLTPT